MPANGAFAFPSNGQNLIRSCTLERRWRIDLENNFIAMVISLSFTSTYYSISTIRVAEICTHETRSSAHTFAKLSFLFEISVLGASTCVKLELFVFRAFRQQIGYLRLLPALIFRLQKNFYERPFSSITAG